VEHLPFGETVFDNTIRPCRRRAGIIGTDLFNEHEREDGTLMWLMRKNQCMHCADRVARACPDGAIVQYTMASSISASQLHRLRYCITDALRHSEDESETIAFSSAPCARSRE